MLHDPPMPSVLPCAVSSGVQPSHGFTLPELLIGLAVGLSVLATALTVWHNGRSLWLGFVAQQQLQHNARRVLEAIEQQARLAGAATLLGVAGSSGLTPSAPYDDTAPELRASDGGKAGDTLSLGHWHSVDAADCLGNRSSNASLVLSQFQRSATTPNDLACKDVRASGSTFQALAEGVEDLQVQLAEASVDGQRVQWKTPSQVSSWSRVQAIEVCLRLVSSLRVAALDAGIVGCSGERIAADGHVRRVVRRIVFLRQRVGVTP